MGPQSGREPADGVSRAQRPGRGVPAAGEPARDDGRHPAAAPRGRGRALRPGSDGTAGAGHHDAELQGVAQVHEGAGLGRREIGAGGRIFRACGPGAGGGGACPGGVLAAAVGAPGSAQVDTEADPGQGEQALDGRARAGCGAGPGLPAHAGDHGLRPRGGHLPAAAAASTRASSAPPAPRCGPRGCSCERRAVGGRQWRCSPYW